MDEHLKRLSLGEGQQQQQQSQQQVQMPPSPPLPPSIWNINNAPTYNAIYHTADQSQQQQQPPSPIRQPSRPNVPTRGSYQHVNVQQQQQQQFSPDLPGHLEQAFIHRQYLERLQQPYDNGLVNLYRGQQQTTTEQLVYNKGGRNQRGGGGGGSAGGSPKKAPAKKKPQQSQNPPIKILQRPVASSPKNGPKKGTGPLPPPPPPTTQIPTPPTLPSVPSTQPGPSMPGRAGQKAKKLTPAQQQRLKDEIARDRVESTFRQYLQNPKIAPSSLLRSPLEARLLTDLIAQNMNYLCKRLADPETTYLDIADKRHDDFAFYDDRLMEAIRALNLVPAASIERYESILERYRNLHPPSVWKFRMKLLEVREKAIAMEDNGGGGGGKKNGFRSSLDYKMVTYKQVNPFRLHKILLNHRSSDHQLAYFLDEIGLSPEGAANLDRFVAALRAALETSPLAELGVKVHPFGSLSNGLGTYDSDLDIVLQFKKVVSASDRLDYETCLLILKIIRTILPKRLDFCRRLPKNLIVPSKRCPIIKLDFEDCCPELKAWVRDFGSGRDPTRPGRPLAFNKCDISVTSIYGLHNSKLLKFFTILDRRFYEMALLLKYWAKKNALICTEAFSSYAFVMLIIFFLQTRTPAILPSIGQLQQLARDDEVRFKPTRVHQWRFEFADDVGLVRQALLGGVRNELTTVQLIPEFFRYYQSFDYNTSAISTRLGAVITKEALYEEKVTQGLEYAFKRTLVVIEDPFVLEHNPGSIFHEHYMPKWSKTLTNVLDIWKINETNAVLLLTDPDLWDNTPPPKDAGRDSKEAKELRKLLKKVQENMAAVGERVNLEVQKALREKKDAQAKVSEDVQDEEEAAVEHKEVDESRQLDETLDGSRDGSRDGLESEVDTEVDGSVDGADGSSDGGQMVTVSNRITNGLPPAPKTTLPIDYKMITYRKVDQRALHESLKTKSGRAQIDELIRTIRLSPEVQADMNRFVSTFSQALTTTVEMAVLKPRLLLVGSLTSGLALYNADINLVVCFEANGIPPELLVDFEHSKTAIKILQSLLHHKLGFDRRPMKRERGSIPTRKRAILPLNFMNCIKLPSFNYHHNHQQGDRKYNRCDISIGLSYGTAQSRLLAVLGRIDSRFTALTMVLKYWAKQNGFINQDLYKQNYSWSSYAFTLLVVFFCQVAPQPPLLPKLSVLIGTTTTAAASAGVIGDRQPGSSSSTGGDHRRMSPPKWMGKYELEVKEDYGLMEPKNESTVQEFVVQFFQFYLHFNFELNAICPRRGAVVTKKTLYLEKSSQGRNFKKSAIVIEDPLVHEMNVGDGQDRRRWTAALDKFLVELQMNSQNCIALLTDPNQFGIGFIPSYGKQATAAAAKLKAAATAKNDAPESKDGLPLAEAPKTEGGSSTKVVAPKTEPTKAN